MIILFYLCIDFSSISGIYGLYSCDKVRRYQGCAIKIPPTIRAGNIDLEEFERCDGAEGLYVLHCGLGEWYFSFRELAIVVSGEVHPGDL